ncbi:MAG: prepilin-type N-terminal cleavage/methylation domain-containing protein, partial [Oscillospiraceae bacterium]|nr:prepilin-type N-terminal cleavage/methylation domain-containing protein [Oscillospiraceae bacterium]
MVNKLRQKLHKNGKKGFTLVELIVVIVIILILAAVMVPLLMNYIGQANEANAKSSASTLMSQVQADFAASQAGQATGVDEPGKAGGNRTTVNGVTIDAKVASDADITQPAEQHCAYKVASGGGTGKATYEEIVEFQYNDGKYLVTWKQNPGTDTTFTNG